MSPVLFEHNRTAYEAVCSCFARTGKAAVIHPTGTGKSFIAFCLCADHPQSTILWLAPSQYIYETQKENWRRAGGGELSNICFCTYVKLMLLGEEEIAQRMPDYIVLDEFHRCGAKQWGQGVKRLLKHFPHAKLLGLSATNIRYLDHQRDMAKELFDNSIASQMTLGEAIVRGILHPPKYILSVYSLQKSFRQYEQRVRLAKSTAVQEAAGKELEALRRALEQSEGLEETFYRHMTDPCGKYLVFCAGYEHMQEMIQKAPQWFQKVDSAPRIYSVYAKEPETSQAFAKFKSDTSRHLKLLFCIDMLNEGIHVEDVSGVILLRPTVSPVIYKQQIGRALSASQKKDAVIFDVVLNIENLTSIGAVEEEMQAALAHCQSFGREREIVHRQFRILDETADCLRLFAQLEGTLNASWDLMYEAASQYYQTHGHLEVPKRYQTQNGLSLGAWINTQRRVYAGKIPGLLDEKQVERLNRIAMRWDDAAERAWERNYAEAENYYRTHGHLLCGAREQVNGVALGQWLAQMRLCKKKTANRTLKPERERALNRIGMVWDVPAYLWEQSYEAALVYYQEYGNLDVPANYVTEDGIRLGAWINKMRSARQKRLDAVPNGQTEKSALSEAQIARLDQIGMIWDSRRDTAWEESYEAARNYWQKHGNLKVPAAFVTEEGYCLGKWLRRQREAQNTLSEERKQKLNQLGMIWQKSRSKKGC